MGDDHISFLRDGCNIEGIQSTRAKFLEGKPLLSTCRQVYHEAVTTFLKSNTRTIASSGFRASRCQVVTILQDAAIFLSALGSVRIAKEFGNRYGGNMFRVGGGGSGGYLWQLGVNVEVLGAVDGGEGDEG